MNAENHLPKTVIGRDDSFWFTAAVVGFNAALLQGDYSCECSRVFVLMVSGVVSLIGAHCVLDRSLQHSIDAGATELPAPPEGADRLASARWGHTSQRIWAAWKRLPFIAAELSGTFFYLVLIAAVLLVVMTALLGPQEAAVVSR